MPIGKNRKRIMITVSDEMAGKIEFYSNKMGVTMSALCAQMVGQAIMGYDKAYNLVDEMAKRLVDAKVNENGLPGQIDISQVLSAKAE
jgi:hypothetical protein